MPVRWTLSVCCAQCEQRLLFSTNYLVSKMFSRSFCFSFKNRINSLSFGWEASSWQFELCPWCLRDTQLKTLRDISLSVLVLRTLSPCGGNSWALFSLGNEPIPQTGFLPFITGAPQKKEDVHAGDLQWCCGKLWLQSQSFISKIE